MLGLEDFEAWNLALADLQEDVIRVLLCLERCVDCVPEPLSWRLFAYSSRSVPIWLYLDTTKKWQWLQGSVAASHSVSRSGPPPGRFSQPLLSAGKNDRGVGRAWGLRGRQPLSAVRTRTGEGGGRVQSHPAPKPGGGARGVVVRVCVGGAM